MKSNSPAKTRISAFISVETGEMLETLMRETGVKKGRVLETALLHQLQALQELPADVVTPPQIVISRKSGEAVLRRIRSGRPNKAVIQVMKRRGR